VTVVANTQVKALPKLPLEDALTERQKRFVNHPQANLDPVRAAIDSGYSQSYAEAYAWTLRRQLLYYITQKRHQLAEWSPASAEHTLAQVAAIATSDLLDYFEYVDTDQGARLQIKENLKALPAAQRAALKKIEFETVVLPNGTAVTVVSKLELHSKTDMLKELIEIHRLKDAGGADPQRTAMLKGLSVSQLQRLEDTLTEIQEEVKTENRAKRERDAIDAE